ncbi:MAG: hypothetical protein AB8E15_10545 [Bdellovibrionales bacterium]
MRKRLFKVIIFFMIFLGLGFFHLRDRAYVRQPASIGKLIKHLNQSRMKEAKASLKKTVSSPSIAKSLFDAMKYRSTKVPGTNLKLSWENGKLKGYTASIDGDSFPELKQKKTKAGYRIQRDRNNDNKYDFTLECRKKTCLSKFDNDFDNKYDLKVIRKQIGSRTLRVTEIELKTGKEFVYYTKGGVSIGDDYSSTEGDSGCGKDCSKVESLAVFEQLRGLLNEDGEYVTDGDIDDFDGLFAERSEDALNSFYPVHDRLLIAKNCEGILASDVYNVKLAGVNKEDLEDYERTFEFESVVGTALDVVGELKTCLSKEAEKFQQDGDTDSALNLNELLHDLTKNNFEHNKDKPLKIVCQDIDRYAGSYINSDLLAHEVGIDSDSPLPKAWVDNLSKYLPKEHADYLKDRAESGGSGLGAIDNTVYLNPDNYDKSPEEKVGSVKKLLAHELLHAHGRGHGTGPEIQEACSELCFPSSTTQRLDKSGQSREGARKICAMGKEFTADNVDDYFESYMKMRSTLGDDDSYFFTGGLSWSTRYMGIKEGKVAILPAKRDLILSALKELGQLADNKSDMDDDTKRFGWYRIVDNEKNENLPGDFNTDKKSFAEIIEISKTMPAEELKRRPDLKMLRFFLGMESFDKKEVGELKRQLNSMTENDKNAPFKILTNNTYATDLIEYFRTTLDVLDAAI